MFDANRKILTGFSNAVVSVFLFDEIEIWGRKSKLFPVIRDACSDPSACTAESEGGWIATDAACRHKRLSYR